MNRVILAGRLTKDFTVNATGNGTTVGRGNIAVDRRYKKDGEQEADFINLVAFGKVAEFLEKYGTKGMKFVLEGRLNTGSYTNKDNQKVYTTDVIVDAVEFAERRTNVNPDPTGFEDADDLPFN